MILDSRARAMQTMQQRVNLSVSEPQDVLEVTRKEESRPKLVPQRFGAFRAAHPKLRDPLIEGVLRECETLCLHGKAKAGKSWTMLHLCLCIATGSPWFNRFCCERGPVLIIDNELDPANLAQRVETVAEAMFLQPADYEDNLHILSLRGNLRNIHQLSELLVDIPPRTYRFVLLDALYRMLPEGASENDNSAMAQVFNAIDGYATSMQAAFGVVHHQSKGSQSDKSVVDVGSGASAFSRAVDAHLVLREHEDEGHVVFDGAVRSWKPLEPFVMRWEFPLWTPASDADPTALKGRRTAGDERQTKKDREGCERVMLALRTDGPMNIPRLHTVTGFGKGRLTRLLAMIRESGNLELDRTEKARNGTESEWYKLTD
ncbi:MAG: AAA family ATPase [Planctomycetaceae bacterium]